MYIVQCKFFRVFEFLPDFVVVVQQVNLFPVDFFFESSSPPFGVNLLIPSRNYFVIPPGVYYKMEN